MLKSRFASAAIWSIAGSGVQYTVTFLLLVYLAHILSPHDFGLMATVSIGLDLGTRIARWGQAELLQQKRYRTDEAQNQSFRCSLLIGALLALAFVIAAPALGRLYASDMLVTLAYMCAPICLFSATSGTAEAILRRDYKYHVLAVRNTIGTLIGAAVAIAMTSMHFGAEALAMQKLVQTALSAIWLWAAVDWRPSLRLRLPRVPGLFREGTSVMFGTLMPLLVPRTIDLFVGFFLGPAQLGIMRVAFRISEFVGQLVVMPLASVANTKLSTQADDLPGMQRSYLRLTHASAGLMCPILIGLSLVAEEAIPLLFGHQWVSSVPFVQVIGLIGLVAPINYYFPAAMMALGQSKMLFRQGIVQVIVGVTLAAIASQISLLAIAVAHVLRATIIAIHNIYDLKRHMKLPLTQLFAWLAAPYAGTLVMAIAIPVVRLALPPGLSPLLTLGILIPAGALAFGGTVALGSGLKLWPFVTGLLPKRLFARAA
jgi:O-antigen/teichoic acid export membrane protein